MKGSFRDFHEDKTSRKRVEKDKMAATLKASQDLLQAERHSADEDQPG